MSGTEIEIFCFKVDYFPLDWRSFMKVNIKRNN